jgi:hypothetical protein
MSNSMMIEELSKIATELEVDFEVVEPSQGPDEKVRVMVIKGSSIQFFDLGATAVARVMIRLRPEDGERLKSMAETGNMRPLMAIAQAASHGPYYHSFELDDQGRISIINIDRRATFRASEVFSVQLFIDILQELMERVMLTTAALAEIFGASNDQSSAGSRTDHNTMYG